MHACAVLLAPNSVTTRCCSHHEGILTVPTRLREFCLSRETDEKHVHRLLLPDAARLHHGCAVQNSCDGNKQTGGDRVQDAENRNNKRAK